MPYIQTNSNWKNNIRTTIQRHCKDTKSYKGAEDIFYSVYGIGEGYWGLNSYKSTISTAEISPVEQRQIDIINKDSSLNITEKESIILSRRGQGDFRKKVIDKYKSCIVTKISDKRLLVASHIKPWRDSNNTERISSENGLLLSSLYDKLFDIGLITFKLNGCIAVSNKLSEENKSIIKIDESYKFLRDLSFELKRNIEYHNDKIFLR